MVGKHSLWEARGGRASRDGEEGAGAGQGRTLSHGGGPPYPPGAVPLPWAPLPPSWEPPLSSCSLSPSGVLLSLS